LNHLFLLIGRLHFILEGQAAARDINSNSVSKFRQAFIKVQPRLRVRVNVKISTENPCC
jgi:hypothetical protein